MTAVTDALNTLWNKVEQDDLKILLPVADTYLGNLVAANGDPLVVVAQTKLLVDSVEASGVTIAKTDLADVATALKTLMDLEAATLITPPAPTPAAA